MLKGGYRILNLLSKDLTVNVGMVYDGVYEVIEGTRKPILLSGLVVDGKEYHDVFLDFKAVGTTFVASAYGYDIIVNDVDVVKVVESSGGGAGASVIDMGSTYPDAENPGTFTGAFNKLVNFIEQGIPVVLKGILYDSENPDIPDTIIVIHARYTGDTQDSITFQIGAYNSDSGAMVEGTCDDDDSITFPIR